MRKGLFVPADSRRIEALGLYHVLPGSRALTIALAGGAAGRERTERRCWSIPELPALARQAGARAVAFGWAEPSIGALAPESLPELLVSALDVVRDAGLVAMLRSDGAPVMMSGAATDFLAPHLDVVSLPVPTLIEATARRDGHVLPHLLRDHLQRLRRAGVWVETSTQLEPGANDSTHELLEIALSLKAIDPAIPWHVRAAPCEESEGLLASWGRTAIERALEAGARAGLAYVYAADAPGSDRELTFCATCRDVVLIERFQGQPRSYLAEGVRCPRCRTRAPGLFHPVPRPRVLPVG